MFAKSNGLGWSDGISDRVFYLETGHVVRRHYASCSLSCTGMLYKEHDSRLLTNHPPGAETDVE